MTEPAKLVKIEKDGSDFVYSRYVGKAKTNVVRTTAAPLPNPFLELFRLDPARMYAEYDKHDPEAA